MNGFSMEDIYPLVEEAISKNGKFRFYPRGRSMLPLIREDIDSVVFAKAENIKKYDMVLYRRDSGDYVLHRLVKTRDGEYFFCGDNQFIIERGIKEKQILASVEKFYRGDKEVLLIDIRYIIYSRCRVASIPLRRFISRIKIKLRKIIKKISRI